MNKLIKTHLDRTQRQWGGTGLMALICVAVVSGCASPSERLTKAVAKGDMAAVTKIMQGGYKPAEARPQLNMAAARGDTTMIRLLLDAGVTVNGGGATPLMAAARNGHLEAVQLLIEKGADINSRQSALVFRDIQQITDNGVYQARFQEECLPGQGNSALSLAILNKHPKVVRYLVDHGADRSMEVVYKDADSGCPFALGQFGSNTTLQIQLQGPQGMIYFRREGGVVTTNCRWQREETATIAKMAEMSGDKEIKEMVGAGVP